MAIALTLQQSGEGVELDFEAVDANDTYFDNRAGDSNLRIRNTGAAKVTVTLVTKHRCNQGFVQDEVFELDPNREWTRSVFKKRKFNDVNQLVHLKFSFATGILAAAYR